jgi:putative PIN family toxin of toxin-antitoxin system
MRIVLDANVIIAAFAARGLCESVFELCLHGHELLLSEDLLAEVERNLSAKIKLPSETVAGIVDLLRENAAIMKPTELPGNVCRDPDDVGVLGLALAGKADAIVTGDRDLLVLERFRGVSIITPREFSDMISKE